MLGVVDEVAECILAPSEESGRVYSNHFHFATFVSFCSDRVCATSATR